MAQFEIHSLGRAKLAGKFNTYIVRAMVFNNMNIIGTKILAKFTARAKGIREIRNTQITDASRGKGLNRLTLTDDAQLHSRRWVEYFLAPKLAPQNSGRDFKDCTCLEDSHTPQENYSISEEDRWKNKINASILYTTITYIYNYSVCSI